MQTFRKLPTMLPNANRTTDHKWNGTRAQTSASKMGLMAINISFERHPHHLDGRRLASPQRKSRRALKEQHSQPVGRAAAGDSGLLQETRLRRAIKHVVGGGGSVQ